MQKWGKRPRSGIVRVRDEYKKGKTDAQGMRVVIVRSGDAVEKRRIHDKWGRESLIVVLL